MWIHTHIYQYYVFIYVYTYVHRHTCNKNYIWFIKINLLFTIYLYTQKTVSVYYYFLFQPDTYRIHFSIQFFFISPPLIILTPQPDSLPRPSQAFVPLLRFIPGFPEGQSGRSRGASSYSKIQVVFGGQGSWGCSFDRKLHNCEVTSYYMGSRLGRVPYSKSHIHNCLQLLHNSLLLLLLFFWPII